MAAAAAGWVLWLVALLHLLSRVLANMEGDALNSLKSNLKDPNNVLQSWDPTLVNPCTWFHVTCDNENTVIRVDLGNAALSGSLVPQLGQLKNLQYLELYSNNITGQIPIELGNLTSLVSLDLYLNNFTGEIPDTLGRLTKLRFLHLGGPDSSMRVKFFVWRLLHGRLLTCDWLSQFLRDIRTTCYLCCGVVCGPYFVGYSFSLSIWRRLFQNVKQQRVDSGGFASLFLAWDKSWRDKGDWWVWLLIPSCDNVGTMGRKEW